MRKTVVDLFCGAGGLSEGFRQAGFSVVAGNDFDAQAGETFKATHPEAKFLEGSIADISVPDMLAAAELERGELTCLVGGPPCQAYSVYNHQRGMHDKRSGLFREYLRMVQGLQPEWIVMENVTGITSVGNGQAVREITVQLGELGYAVEVRKLLAEEYGVPQERRRIVFVGNRVGKPIFFPEPTHGPELRPYVTVKDAIGDLPVLRNGGEGEGLGYRMPPDCEYQEAMRGRCRVVRNHSAPRLAAVNMERMQHIPQGGSWRDVPFDLLPAGMKRAKRSDHTKRYGRMKPDGLSCTILTKCDIHWGAYIHPEQNRSITVREAARLQSFPDWFVFTGSKTDQYVQVGNAVPPRLAKAVAETINDSDCQVAGSTGVKCSVGPQPSFIH